MIRSKNSSWRLYNRTVSSPKDNLSLCLEASTWWTVIMLMVVRIPDRAFCRHLIRYSGRITIKAPFLITSKPMSSSRVESLLNRSLNQLWKKITLRDLQKNKKKLWTSSTLKNSLYKTTSYLCRLYWWIRQAVANWNTSGQARLKWELSSILVRTWLKKDSLKVGSASSERLIGSLYLCSLTLVTHTCNQIVSRLLIHLLLAKC